ncbi:MAG: hypothetical protein ACOX1N_00405 [Candidatus Methanomethylophilaceae archaeon]|jgi:ABC-type Fe3+-hydroxamate transport system substrate-binding protein
MNESVIAVIAVLLLGAAGVGGIIFLGPGEESDFTDYKSDTLVKDFKDREVPVPTSLDGGIITAGRFSALRWLAYFPEEFEKVIMVDDTVNVDSQGSLDYSYAYGDILSGVETHSRDSMSDSEKMVARNPSLIIVDSHIYREYKEICENISKLVPLAVVNAFENLSNDGFWTEDYQLTEEFKDQAVLFGKILDNEERAGEIIEYFQETLDDVRSYCTGTSDTVTYVAGPVSAGSNPLSTTFNPYLCQQLTGGENAMDRTDVFHINLSVEEVEQLSFNRMVIEPSTILPNKGGPNLLETDDSQGVLKLVSKRNTDDDPDNDIRMFVVLPSISHGVNPLCVLASAYHLASVEYDTLNVEEIKQNADAMFKKFYGDERGGRVMSGLDEYYSGIKHDVHEDICTDLFCEVEVKVLDNGKYIFAKKVE